MTLDKFLVVHKAQVISLCWEKTKSLAGGRAESELLKAGLPLFYDQLIVVLTQKLVEADHRDILASAANHGKELLRLGFSLSHVVHAYGAMCQSITELATLKSAQITADEFNILNGCLDIAIASAVSEFQFQSNEANDVRELKHLGFLAHELRNALSSATMAHEMIKAGLVGTGGSTANVLEANLHRMKTLIDRSLSEVRMRADADLYIEKFRLSELLEQIAITANADALKRLQTLHRDVDWSIEVESDRQFILSAISNLVQNAIKYSKIASSIWVRASLVGDRVHIEIEDECGGLDPSKVEALFEPYVQEHADRSGLGLGLAIVQRAVHLVKGTITVKNNPGTGCTFVLEFPQRPEVEPSLKSAVPGRDSVQPKFQNKTR